MLADPTWKYFTWALAGLIIGFGVTWVVTYPEPHTPTYQTGEPI